jgi:hypothetical protein
MQGCGEGCESCSLFVVALLAPPALLVLCVLVWGPPCHVSLNITKKDTLKTATCYGLFVLLALSVTRLARPPTTPTIP